MKRMLLLVLAVIALTFIAGYAVSSKLTQTANSGIYGTATIGPTCPVQRLGQVCTRFYEGKFIVKNQYGIQVAAFTTTINGEFRIPLLPGTYTIVQADKALLPKARVITVTVMKGAYTQVAIQLDTGIR